MNRPGDDAKALAAAEDAWRKALETSEGGYNEARYGLGLILLRQEREQEGLAALKEFLEREPASKHASRVKQILARPLCGREACAPEFSLVTADGEYLTHENLNGKVTLLHFWTVWEGWREEMWPAMKRLALWSKKADSPVQIIGISGTHDESRSREFMKQYGMTWPVCVDSREKVSAAFDVRSFPTSILINHEGIVVYRRLNWGTDLADEINQEISMAVGALKKARKAEAKGADEKGKDAKDDR